MTEIIDLDGYGRHITNEKYKRLGATQHDDHGMYVRFEPGFGLNVHIGIRTVITGSGTWSKYDDEKMAMSIEGWETLCGLVDEYREREARLNGNRTDASPRGSS